MTRHVTRLHRGGLGASAHLAPSFTQLCCKPITRTAAEAAVSEAGGRRAGAAASTRPSPRRPRCAGLLLQQGQGKGEQDARGKRHLIDVLLQRLAGSSIAANADLAKHFFEQVAKARLELLRRRGLPHHLRTGSQPPAIEGRRACQPQRRTHQASLRGCGRQETKASQHGRRARHHLCPQKLVHHGSKAGLVVDAAHLERPPAHKAAQRRSNRCRDAAMPRSPVKPAGDRPAPGEQTGSVSQDIMRRLQAQSAKRANTQQSLRPRREPSACCLRLLPHHARHARSSGSRCVRGRQSAKLEALPEQGGEAYAGMGSRSQEHKRRRRRLPGARLPLAACRLHSLAPRAPGPYALHHRPSNVARHQAPTLMGPCGASCRRASPTPDRRKPRFHALVCQRWRSPPCLQVTRQLHPPRLQTHAHPPPHFEVAVGA